MTVNYVKKMEPQKILDLPMGLNDAEAGTVREYLKTLLRHVWGQKEMFSGKRPFGNSGWEYELYYALVKGRAIRGRIDDELEAIDFDAEEADAAIRSAIEALS